MNRSTAVVLGLACVLSAEASATPCQTAADCIGGGGCVDVECVDGQCSFAWSQAVYPDTVSPEQECIAKLHLCDSNGAMTVVQIPLENDERCGGLDSSGPDLVNGNCIYCAPEDTSCTRCKRESILEAIVEPSPEDLITDPPPAQTGVLLKRCGDISEANCPPAGGQLACARVDTIPAQCRSKSGANDPNCAAATQSECTSAPLNEDCDWKPEVPGYCRPLTGACCNDYNEHTVADRIVEKPEGSKSAVCLGTDRCDDGNPCTRDFWDADDPSGPCMHEPWFTGVSGLGLFGSTSIPSSATPIFACDDGDSCTFLDRCEGMECRGTPVEEPTLPAGDASCRRLLCSGDGRSAWTLLDGHPCSDGDICTTGERCLSGSCGGGSAVDCSDDDPCTLGSSCSSQSGCDLPTAPSGTPCDDGLACTIGDACLGASRTVCRGTVSCDDSDPDTDDYCDDAGDCIHAASPAPLGFPFPHIFLGPPDDPRYFGDINFVVSNGGTAPPPPPGASGGVIPPSYATLESIDYCSSAVADPLNRDEDPPAGPSCVVYECTSSTCDVPTALPDVATTVRRVAGRNEGPGFTSHDGFMVLNAGPWLKAPSEGAPIGGTIAMWVGLDDVHGVYGLGRVPLLDTAPPSNESTSRLRIEIGHLSELDVITRGPRTASVGKRAWIRGASCWSS